MSRWLVAAHWIGHSRAGYYDEHVPESSVEILGHSAGGVTYRHYAHRAPLAFPAILGRLSCASTKPDGSTCAR